MCIVISKFYKDEIIAFNFLADIHPTIQECATNFWRIFFFINLGDQTFDVFQYRIMKLWIHVSIIYLFTFNGIVSLNFILFVVPSIFWHLFLLCYVLHWKCEEHTHTHINNMIYWKQLKTNYEMMNKKNVE